MVYWIRWFHLFGGRLAISLVRNDALLAIMRQYRVDVPAISAHTYREAGLGGYFTIRIGSIWMNVDLIA